VRYSSRPRASRRDEYGTNGAWPGHSEIAKTRKSHRPTTNTATRFVSLLSCCASEAFLPCCCASVARSFVCCSRSPTISRSLALALSMANNYKYNPNLRHFEVPCLRGVAKGSIALIGVAGLLFTALQMTRTSSLCCCACLTPTDRSRAHVLLACLTDAPRPIALLQCPATLLAPPTPPGARPPRRSESASPWTRSPRTRSAIRLASPTSVTSSKSASSRLARRTPG